LLVLYAWVTFIDNERKNKTIPYSGIVPKFFRKILETGKIYSLAHA
jgi:hypothetical protein